MNPLVRQLLAVARSFLGEMESPAYSNLHPSVTWYNKTIEYLARSWNYCAAGVSRTFYLTPGAAKLHKPRAYVPWEMQDFLNGVNGGKLIWIDSSLAEARPGDVVFFDWSKPSDGRHSVWTGNHVGIIESVRSSTECITLEHNTSVPGTGNEGTTRKVRDVRYIVAVGRPNWGSVPNPKIPGTELAPLEVDGDLGAKTIFAWGTVMRSRGYSVTPARTIRPDLVKAIQADLRKKGIKDREGKSIVVDGKGLGSNSQADYPRSGWTRTISALQRGHGVKVSRADGVFSNPDSSEVRRIQRDINTGGVKDSPNYTG